MRPYAKVFGDLLSTRKQLSDERLRALTAFRDAVRDGSFPRRRAFERHAAR